MITKIKAWLGSHVVSALTTVAVASVGIQVLVGTFLDLLVGTFQVGLVIGAFRLGGKLSK